METYLTVIRYLNSILLIVLVLYLFQLKAKYRRAITFMKTMFNLDYEQVDKSMKKLRNHPYLKALRKNISCYKKGNVISIELRQKPGRKVSEILKEQEDHERENNDSV